MPGHGSVYPGAHIRALVLISGAGSAQDSAGPIDRRRRMTRRPGGDNAFDGVAAAQCVPIAPGSSTFRPPLCLARLFAFRTMRVNVGERGPTK